MTFRVTRKLTKTNRQVIDEKIAVYEQLLAENKLEEAHVLKQRIKCLF